MAEGGSFASTPVDLVRAIRAARQASRRGAIGYLRGTEEELAAWDAECAEAMPGDVAYAIERSQAWVTQAKQDG